MSEKVQRRLCAIIGCLGLFFAIGIVGGIDQGAPLGNVVYAFLSMMGSGIAFFVGGFMA